jgi:hypothetical protein
MGIDFSYCDAHWPYSGFHRFRKRLALALGLNLDEMIGFGGKRSWDTVDDPIKGLLDHSDCEGDLTPAQCRIIASRLREMVAAWADDDHDKKSGLELAKGMEASANADESLKFC